MVQQWLLTITHRELQRFRFWIKNNFSGREARWAVEHKIAISSDMAKLLVRARREEVKFFLERLVEIQTERQAIRFAQRNLRAKNLFDGFEPYNIFRITSPWLKRVDIMTNEEAFRNGALAMQSLIVALLLDIAPQILAIQPPPYSEPEAMPLGKTSWNANAVGEKSPIRLNRD